eukprot:CAMPEP_0198283184 /NCGR_PEP_ID=MMETSP1449-20131203/2853_1 /TAXON_ID=420275 /ORGANISM="Attheya septentrionalis, Strain CCMP2084" /LENGTH=264 /DNA_ID=CAMNT_0043979721 /DNA_START=218 /DNA_END=1012 /DNA_ORIENTATION=+
MVEYAKRLYKEKGTGVFWEGVETSAIQSATEKALYFFAYTLLKNAHHSLTGTPHPSTTTNLAMGCMAEWAHLPVTLPIDCLTTKICTSKTNESPYALFMAMLSEKGVKGMYRGIQAYWVLCLKPSIQYTVFEQLKRRSLVRSGKRSLSSGEAFLLGMIARTIATMCVFPYLRVKVVMQARQNTTTRTGTSTSNDDVENNPHTPPPQTDEPEESIVEMLWHMQKGGDLFRGIGPELTRGVLSAAFMLMAKERISSLIHNMVLSKS